MSSSSTSPPGAAIAPRLRHTTLGRLARLCRKELREILRDRRTIITLVVMPLLVYPLLSVTFQQFFLQSFASNEVDVYVIGAESDEDQAELLRQLARGDEWIKRTGPERENATGRDAAENPAPPLFGGEAVEAELSWAEGGDLRQHLIDGEIDVAIIKADEDRADAARWQLLYRENSPLSRAALHFVEQRLRAANERYLRERLQGLGENPELPASFEPAAVPEAQSFSWVTTMIPLILILMTITGAVYPAIDLTAGERERGTLETLMAAPVPRGELLLAKYVAVLTVALLTATANLTAMTLTLSVGGFSTLLWGEGGLSPLVLVEVFGLTVLFAAFFSAVVLALTSFARSFKEAQAYLIPLMLLCLTPGVISLMPGLELSSTLSIVPLVNIVLLARDVLAGEAVLLPAIVSIVSTLLYALAAIGIAARVFGSDAILYGSQSGWSDLLRRPDEPRPTATLSAALFCLALMFPATFLASGLLSKLAGSGLLELSIALIGVVTLLVYGMLPGLFAQAQRVDPTSAFRAYPPQPRALLAAVLLGVGIWPLVHGLFLLGKYLGLGGFDFEQQEFVQQIVDRWQMANPVVILISFALIPALCEEWFFRGYLFSALLKTTGALGAILLSALLFGAFHVVSSSALTTERFITTTLLGLVLGVVAWRTGSVLPGIVMHVVHNGILISIAIFANQLAARGWGVEPDSHLPVAWIVAAVIVTAAGAAVLFTSGPAVGEQALETESRESLGLPHDELKVTSG